MTDKEFLYAYFAFNHSSVKEAVIMFDAGNRTTDYAEQIAAKYHEFIEDTANRINALLHKMDFEDYDSVARSLASRETRVFQDSQMVFRHDNTFNNIMARLNRIIKSHSESANRKLAVIDGNTEASGKIVKVGKRNE